MNESRLWVSTKIPLKKRGETVPFSEWPSIRRFEPLRPVRPFFQKKYGVYPIDLNIPSGYEKHSWLENPQNKWRFGIYGENHLFLWAMASSSLC